MVEKAGTADGRGIPNQVSNAFNGNCMTQMPPTAMPLQGLTRNESTCIGFADDKIRSAQEGPHGLSVNKGEVGYNTGTN